jgi:Family of unknown function (DUF6490)
MVSVEAKEKSTRMRGWGYFCGSLFWFLRLYEQAGQNAAQRGRQKAAIWMLSTYLTSIFSYKVASLMPWPIALVVWGMGATVAYGGFYAFFIYHA